MKADQIVTAIEDNRSDDEQSPNHYFPPDFFRHDVTVSKGTLTTPVNPRYCATDKGTQMLSAVITEELGWACEPVPEGGYPDSRNVALTYGWVYSTKVGAIRITIPERGVLDLNAGMILDNFVHGYPPLYALHRVKLELEWDLFEGGLIDAPPAPAERY